MMAETPVGWIELQAWIDECNRLQRELWKIREQEGVKPGEPLIGLKL